MKTKTNLGLLAGAFLILSAATAEALTPQGRKGEKVVAVRAVKGRTQGFEMGDYSHVVILTTNGEKKSFFIFKPGLDYFLALHKGSLSSFTYEVADVNLPETGGMTRIERLVSAKVGSLSFESWWKKVRSKYSLEQLDNKYGSLVRRYELK